MTDKEKCIELYIKFGDRGMQYSDVQFLSDDLLFDYVDLDLRTGLAKFTTKALELIKS